jgi:RNA polymerase sigma-54 factor
MKPGLELKLGQHLTMTPQLQQAIRLLQLSTLDLRQEVQSMLESNPLLDEDVEEGNEPAEALEPRSETHADERQLDLDADDALPNELPVDSQWK